MSKRSVSTVLAALAMVVFGSLPAAQQNARTQDSKSAEVPASPSSHLTEPRGTSGAPIDDKAYVIGPEDILTITVWGEPRLTGPLLVRPDGKISMPLIDELEAGGKTPAELKAEITERLKVGDYIKLPLVDVRVDQINSKKYYLQGEVRSPGAYPLIVPTNVLEALVKAGGFQEFANKKKIRILRMQNGKATEFRFNYNDVSKGKKIEQNIQLKPGDHIIVP
jgi:polysaccharide biosynthesis/export protein